jgi:glycosyltransferase involved in cell wall biosynthesis
VASQTVRPAAWVIVNDGSTDRTRELALEFAKSEPWIRVLDRADRGARALGGGVVEAFNFGLASVADDWDYVVKLDADLEFAPDYFESLLRRFAENPKLGMASGKTFLLKDGVKSIEWCHDDHVRGPAKMYSRACFRAIGGLEAMRGWDMIDETRAQMLGFETRSFVEHELIHLRPIDGRQSHVLRSRFEMGALYWKLGYHWAYHTVRSLRSAAQDYPLVLGGLMLFAGYAGAALRRQPRFEPAYVEFVQKRQLGRFRLAHLRAYLATLSSQRSRS